MFFYSCIYLHVVSVCWGCGGGFTFHSHWFSVSPCENMIYGIFARILVIMNWSINNCSQLDCSFAKFYLINFYKISFLMGVWYCHWKPSIWHPYWNGWLYGSKILYRIIFFFLTTGSHALILWIQLYFNFYFPPIHLTVAIHFHLWAAHRTILLALLSRVHYLGSFVH